MDHPRIMSQADGLVERKDLLTKEKTSNRQRNVANAWLKLLFVCTHPAIDRDVHTPLMLHVALGLDAARISSIFRLPPATMSQRLLSAKARLRDAAIALAVPENGELAARLDAILTALYVAYGIEWEEGIAVANPWRPELIDHVLWLARLMVELLPHQPEAKGLLALFLYCEARRPARRTSDGAFVPISEQDTSLWSRPMTDEAESLLLAAAEARRIGRFQLEAAIQSAFAERVWSGRVEKSAIMRLYQVLVSLAPSIVASLGQAAAVADALGASLGLLLLERILPQSVATHQLYWALRGHLLQCLGRPLEASHAYGRAIQIGKDRAESDVLRGRIQSDVEQFWNGTLEVLRREFERAWMGTFWQ